MTSNAASVAIREFAENKGLGEQLGQLEELGIDVDKNLTEEEAVETALKLTFRPEFINRIDDIIKFSPLNMEILDQIVELQLRDVRGRLAKQGISLDISPAAMDQMAIDGLDPVFGARPLKRLIQRDIVDLVANGLVAGEIGEGSRVLVDLDPVEGYKLINEGNVADGPQLVSLDDLDIDFGDIDPEEDF
ncbi:MAG: hypothetical protein IKG69_07190 [Atopobiaceae bacterium]|nr:hypothetical protein [Atopobiaceae bacterium]